MKSRIRPSRWMALSLVLGVLAAWWALPAAGAGPEKNQAAAATTSGTGSTATKDVTVYYFHGTVRCKTCRTIEAYAKEAIEARYADQLKSGLLKWQVVNIDEPENEHFIDELGLVSSSLVVVTRNGGKETGHEILQDAWTLVRDKPRFTEYVQRAVGGHLK